MQNAMSDFVKDRCTTCAAGWTRSGANGDPIIYCLLDREPVWPDMAACDRYEIKANREQDVGSLRSLFARAAAQCLRPGAAAIS